MDNFNHQSISEFLNNANLSLTTQKRNDLLLIAYELILYHNHDDLYLSNIAGIATDDYFIYYHDAFEFIKNFDIFDLIGVIMQWELEVYGQLYTNFANVVEVANKFIYILIDHIINDFINETNVDHIESKKDFEMLSDWVKESINQL